MASFNQATPVYNDNNTTWNQMLFFWLAAYPIFEPSYPFSFLWYLLVNFAEFVDIRDVRLCLNTTWTSAALGDTMYLFIRFINRRCYDTNDHV